MVTQRVKPAVRRAMIVEAARDVILRRGLAGAGLRDIAAAGGVSIGTVTYHFSSIAEIVTAVLMQETERVYGSAIREADAEDDPVRALILLIDPLFSEAQGTREHWKLWPDYWTAVAHSPTLATELDERIRVWESCAMRVIGRGVEQGLFPPVDASEAALKLAAYSDGIGIQLSQRAHGLDVQTGRRWLLEFLDHQLGDGRALFTDAAVPAAGTAT
jgi:AcrR family transcriptional regulator